MFQGLTSVFVLGTYDSEDIAQRACDAANEVIKKTKKIGDVKSTIQLCRSAAEKATATKSKTRNKDWTPDEDAQVLAVGSRAGQVAIGDRTPGQAKARWDNLHRGKKKKKTWTADEEAQILAVGSRGGQVAIGDWTLSEVKHRWDNLNRKKTAPDKKKTAPVKKKAAPVKKKVRKYPCFVYYL